ncbi:MAG: hypothetical protein DBY35_03165 [Bacteroidales bacterium]|nr:MAG: hypothetical protein DBY35_03165 [Bacteroidales bacterium]
MVTETMQAAQNVMPPTKNRLIVIANMIFPQIYTSFSEKNANESIKCRIFVVTKYSNNQSYITNQSL